MVPDTFLADADQIMGRTLTEGFRLAACGTDLAKACVAENLAGSPLLPGASQSVRSGAFTPEEREEIIRGLETFQG